jgi:hypothetical protein
MLPSPNENLLFEVKLGLAHGQVSLSDKRIVFEHGENEESIPLRAVTSVRGWFARDYLSAAWGAFWLALALVIAGGGYRVLEAQANRSIANVERKLSTESTRAPAEAQEPAHAIRVPGAVIWLLMLPLLGVGGYKLLTGLYGTTELTVSHAGGLVRHVSEGRKKAWIEFAQDVGRRLAES